MEALFKQKLIELRADLAPQTFGEALFTHRYLSFTPSKTAPKIEKGFSEKKHLIESLERFVEEKEVIPVAENAEIGLKKTPDWSPVHNDYQLSKELRELILKGKSKIQVIFVTETLRPLEEIESEFTGQFTDQLLCGFPQKTAQLFERMIAAMKLEPHEVILYPAEFANNNLFDDIVKLSCEYRPQVIMTLGAKATSSVLKIKDRLSVVHGQFFARKVADFDVQVVPLFHPNIIETNQSMKKTAWEDMQKVMKYLKKLP